MKSLLIINSSPRNSGNCVKIIEQIKPYFKECNIMQYNVYSLSASPCIDCKYCENYNGCSQHDLDIFFKNFENADYILFVSPVYNDFFPAPLKAIIDRFQRYFNARYKRGINPPIAKHKNVGIIIVSGSNSRVATDYMMNTLKQSFDILNGTIKTRFFIPNTDIEEYTLSKNEIQKLVNQICSN